MVDNISEANKKLSQFFQHIYYQLCELEPSRIQDITIYIDMNANFFKKFSRRDIELIKDYSLSTDCGFTLHKNYIKINKSLFILEAAKYLDIDIAKLSRLLNWKEFEDLISRIFDKYEFKVIKNFRFTDHSNYTRKTNQKRYEIDVVAMLRGLFLLIDAKHWNCRTNNLSSINKASELQLRRLHALIKNPEAITKLIDIFLNQSEVQKVKTLMPFKLIPIIVTLIENKIKLSFFQVPLVSIFHLNRFIQEFDYNQKYFVSEKIFNINIQKNLINKF